MFFPTDAAAERHCSELRVLRFSMNAPVVALEGLPVGPARAAVALHAGEEPRVTIVLRTTRSGQTLFYCAGDELAEFSSASVVVDAALSFAESMGFLFDDDEVEARGEVGPREAARLWADFIDELPERPAAAREAAAAPSQRAVSEPAAPPRPPAISRSVQKAPPPAAGGPARAAFGDLSPLPATLPEALLSPEQPRAPLAMLDDDGPSDALPFWLLQPDPQRRRSARSRAAPDPNSVPGAPPSAPPELDAAGEPAIGLERKPSVPRRPRVPLARPVAEPEPAGSEWVPTPAPPCAEPAPRHESRAWVQPLPPSAPRAKPSVQRPRPSAGDAPSDLKAALAETGVEHLLQRARPLAPGRPPPPLLSKFRFTPPAASARPAPLDLESKAERDAEPAERQEFESLSLRLRSRF